MKIFQKRIWLHDLFRNMEKSPEGLEKMNSNRYCCSGNEKRIIIDPGRERREISVSEEHKNTVPILEKALDIMEYIGAHPAAVSLPELQKNLGIPQASCYRIVTTLLHRQWLCRRGGSLYDISGGFSAVAAKARISPEKFKKLQPAMNLLANTAGFSAKLSVRDGDEFVNVCSAKTLAGDVIFSEPGFSVPLSNPASVGTIFLAEEPPSEQKRMVGEATMPRLRQSLAFYRKHGFSFHPGSSAPDAVYHFDTLSFPVVQDGRLLAVLSFLSLPGLLQNRMREVADRIVPHLPVLSAMM